MRNLNYRINYIFSKLLLHAWQRQYASNIDFIIGNPAPSISRQERDRGQVGQTSIGERKLLLVLNH